MFILGGFLAVASLLSTTLAEAPIWYKGGKCGVSKYQDAGEMPLPPGKIVGGKEARPNEFPWQVYAIIKGFLCGGSIINERWLVTAAHCIEPTTTAADITLIFGVHEFGQLSAALQVIAVASIIRHENYNELSKINDIALLKTSSDISLNEDVAPICAPDPANLYANQKCLVSGWGDQLPQPLQPVDPGEHKQASTLMYVTLNVSSNEYCNSIFSKPPSPRPMIKDQMCTIDNTGGRQRDSCQGDSGGPLAVKGGDGSFILSGVVSYGYGCAAGVPGLYTRVGSYVTWIADKIA